MGDMTEPTRFRTGAPPKPLPCPPCPTCGGEVANFKAPEVAEDRRFGTRETHMIAGREPVTLVPCGHFVRGWREDATGVLAWADSL